MQKYIDDIYTKDFELVQVDYSNVTIDPILLQLYNQKGNLTKKEVAKIINNKQLNASYYYQLYQEIKNFNNIDDVKQYCAIETICEAFCNDNEKKLIDFLFNYKKYKPLYGELELLLELFNETDIMEIPKYFKFK